MIVLMRMITHIGGASEIDDLVLITLTNVDKGAPYTAMVTRKILTKWCYITRTAAMIAWAETSCVCRNVGIETSSQTTEALNIQR